MNATDATKYIQEIEISYRQDCVSRGLNLDDLISSIRQVGDFEKTIKRIESDPPTEQNDYHCGKYMGILYGASQTDSFNVMGAALALYHLGANAMGILNASSAIIIVIEWNNMAEKFKN